MVKCRPRWRWSLAIGPFVAGRIARSASRRQWEGLARCAAPFVQRRTTSRFAACRGRPSRWTRLMGMNSRCRMCASFAGPAFSRLGGGKRGRIHALAGPARCGERQSLQRGTERGRTRRTPSCCSWLRRRRRRRHRGCRRLPRRRGRRPGPRRGPRQ